MVQQDSMMSSVGNAAGTALAAMASHSLRISPGEMLPEPAQPLLFMLLSQLLRSSRLGITLVVYDNCANPIRWIWLLISISSTGYTSTPSDDDRNIFRDSLLPTLFPRIILPTAIVVNRMFHAHNHISSGLLARPTPEVKLRLTR